MNEILSYVIVIIFALITIWLYFLTFRLKNKNEDKYKTSFLRQW